MWGPARTMLKAQLYQSDWDTMDCCFVVGGGDNREVTRRGRLLTTPSGFAVSPGQTLRKEDEEHYPVQFLSAKQSYCVQLYGYEEAKWAR